jgi:hypothetical protein
MWRAMCHMPCSMLHPMWPRDCPHMYIPIKSLTIRRSHIARKRQSQGRHAAVSPRGRERGRGAGGCPGHRLRRCCGRSAVLASASRFLVSFQLAARRRRSPAEILRSLPIWPSGPRPSGWRAGTDLPQPGGATRLKQATGARIPKQTPTPRRSEGSGIHSLTIHSLERAREKDVHPQRSRRVHSGGVHGPVAEKRHSPKSRRRKAAAGGTATIPWGREGPARIPGERDPQKPPGGQAARLVRQSGAIPVGETAMARVPWTTMIPGGGAVETGNALRA